MAKTSINIQPVKSTSEKHNRREKNLDYVRPELSKKNQSWEKDDIANRLQTITNRYKETTKQAMQKKATPIREGVIVISEKTKMEQLQDFANKCQKRFGIDAFQIHMHKDEGHTKEGDFKPNLHAHIVFDWTNPDTGKSQKLKKQDMAEMQTILAESLKMQRGESSDKKHLSAIQFKNQTEAERSKNILQEQKKIKSEIKSLELSKTVSNAFKNVFAGLEMTKAEKELEQLKIEQEDTNKAYEKRIQTLQEKNTKLKSDLDSAITMIEKRNNDLALYKRLYNSIKKGPDNNKDKGMTL